MSVRLSLGLVVVLLLSSLAGPATGEDSVPAQTKGLVQSVSCEVSPSDGNTSRDAGGSPDDSVPLPEGNSSGCFGPQDTKDVYRFTLNGGESVRVFLDPGSTDVVEASLIECEPPRFPEDSVEPGEEPRPWTLEMLLLFGTEDICLVVEREDGAAGGGGYRLERRTMPHTCPDWEREPGKEALSSGFVWGCIDAVDRWDAYEFDVDEGQSFALNLVPNFFHDSSVASCEGMTFSLSLPGEDRLREVEGGRDCQFSAISGVAPENGTATTGVETTAVGADYMLILGLGEKRDLAPTSLEVERDPIGASAAGASVPSSFVEIEVTVENLGDVRTETRTLELAVTGGRCDPARTLLAPGCPDQLDGSHPSWSLDVPQLKDGETWTATEPWDAKGHLGEHEITAELQSSTRAEADLRNNVMSKEIDLRASGVGHLR